MVTALTWKPAQLPSLATPIPAGGMLPAKTVVSGNPVPAPNFAGANSVWQLALIITPSVPTITGLCVVTQTSLVRPAWGLGNTVIPLPLIRTVSAKITDWMVDSATAPPPIPNVFLKEANWGVVWTALPTAPTGAVNPMGAVVYVRRVSPVPMGCVLRTKVVAPVRQIVGAAGRFVAMAVVTAMRRAPPVPKTTVALSYAATVRVLATKIAAIVPPIVVFVVDVAIRSVMGWRPAKPARTTALR